MELVEFNVNKPFEVGQSWFADYWLRKSPYDPLKPKTYRKVLHWPAGPVGQKRLSGRIVYRNSKTVWVTLPSGRMIKRHIEKHQVRPANQKGLSQ